MESLLSTDFKKYFQDYEGEIFRLVEGQHFIATRKLVDSDDEQRVLENILDKSKPPTPTRNSRGELHYLLYTPFRYPPLNSGGRFHTRLEQSIFYGSEELSTAMAEVAYGRFLFMHHTAATFKPMQVPYTHFVVRVKSSKAILLTQAPFLEQQALISHSLSYACSQAIGSTMRRLGTEIFSYYSACFKNVVNVGLFSLEAFQQNKPIFGKEKNWTVYVSAKTIEFQKAHLVNNRKKSHVFGIEVFYMDRQFPVL